MPQGNPIIPSWVALIGGCIVLLALAAHLLALHGATDMEPRRRRIRMTNAVLMMLVVPFLTYGFGIATPSNQRPFIYVWVVTAALLVMVIFVALIDLLHSWQVHRAELREVRRQVLAGRGGGGSGESGGDERPR